MSGDGPGAHRPQAEYPRQVDPDDHLPFAADPDDFVLTLLSIGEDYSRPRTSSQQVEQR